MSITQSEPPAQVEGIIGDWKDEVQQDVDYDHIESSSSSASASSGAAASHSSQATFMKEAQELQELIAKIDKDPKHVKRIIDILNSYQEASELLDPHLHAIIHQIIAWAQPIIHQQTHGDAQLFLKSPSHTLLHHLFEIFYTLCKVRGYKTISHFVPHQVSDLEPTIRMLSLYVDARDESSWEIRYGLLLWLAVVVMIPFDLNSVDSSLISQALHEAAAASAASAATSATSTPAAAAAASSSTSSASSLIIPYFQSSSSSSLSSSSPHALIPTLLRLGTRALSDTGPPREAAAVMLAKLFSRPDMHAHYLLDFFQWCINTLPSLLSSQHPAHSFLVSGIYRALVEIFHHAPREILITHVQVVFDSLLRDIELANISNTLHRKLLVKLTQRVALTYLPVRIASWRYQRGQRSVINNVKKSDAHTTEEAKQADIVHKIVPPSSSIAAPISSEDDIEDDIPDAIESLIHVLLCGLRDRDTIVRWSSAKGIGRVTSCLSISDGDDVVAAVLEMFSGRESDGAWHGGCLALAELARRGLLLPHRLKQVVPLTTKALFYDQRTSTHSIGAHVRDAACYVIWAFARAYAPDVMAPYVSSLACGLLTLSVFDREVNVRRAASAAYQEHVGRQGAQSFPHGIEILQKADYFTIANRNNAYLSISTFIAQYESYTYVLIDHLVQYKMKHWEKEIRELTAQALGKLTCVQTLEGQLKVVEYMTDAIVPALIQLCLTSSDLCERHGSTLAISEILLALHSLSITLPANTRQQVCTIVFRFQSIPNLLNGRGGQIMRECISRLLATLSKVGIKGDTKDWVDKHQAILDENLLHVNDDVQLSAIKAVRPFVEGYYLRELDPAADAKTQESNRAQRMIKANQVIHHYLRTLANPSALPGATRGFAAALGKMPPAILMQDRMQLTGADYPPNFISHSPLARIISSLCLHSNLACQGDAETRRNCCTALVEISHEIGDQILTFMPALPAPPKPATSSSSSSSAASSKDKEANKAIAKQIKLQIEYIEKYTSDLVRLGIPGHCVWQRIITALLLGLEDYATDNRGDVGSWIREACMLGLETMLNLLGDMEKRVGPIINADMVGKIMQGLMKQMVEKIDRVREIAGAIFHRLLHAPHVQTHVPAAALLHQAMPKDLVIDWSSPQQTFPLLIPIFSLSTSSPQSSSTLVYPYHHPLLSGLVISVGGLTESVVKYSSEYFIAYIMKLNKSIYTGDVSATAELQRVGDGLLQLLTEDKGHARVVIPAFKTLEILLSQSLLNSLITDESSFASDLQSRVWKEVAKSTNIHKVLGAIPVLVGLLGVPPPESLTKLILQCLLILLGHVSFPKVRRMTGEALYNSFIVSLNEIMPELSEEDGATVLDILANTAWDGQLQTARDARSKLYDILKLERPKVNAASSSSTTTRHGDVSALNTDYSALVRAEGY